MNWSCTCESLPDLPSRDWCDVVAGTRCSRWLTASLLMAAGSASAQEALRNSWRNEWAIEARQYQSENQPYNLKMGDFKLLLTPSLGLDWNDNINTSKEDPQQDVILKPMLQLTGSQPITPRSLLRLDLGVGYDLYFQHNDYSGVRLQSGSEIFWDIAIKDIRLNLHDRIQYTQDSAGHSAVANTARFGGLDNMAGLAATWELRSAVLTLGYDHQNFFSSSSEFEYTDRASELLVARGGYRVNPALTAGLEGTVSFTAYNQEVLNDNVAYSGGIYLDWQPGPYFHVQPRVGYTIYDFDQTSQLINAVDQNAWYVDLTLRHGMTEAVAYFLSVGRELRLGIQADLIEAWYFRPGVNWKIVKNLQLNGFFFYEHGEQGLDNEVRNPGGNGVATVSETFDWFGGGLNIHYPLLKRLDLGLHYRLTLRLSSFADREYTQNLVGLLFTYRLP